MLPSNDTLEKITSRLAYYPPNWTETIARFKQSWQYQSGKINLPHTCSLLAEIHIRVALEEISEGMETSFDCLKDGDKSDNYQANIREGQLYIKNSGKDYVEIDELVIVDSLPTIFEIKLTNRRTKRDRRGPSHRGINEMMKPKTIERFSRPIQEFFGNCAYVLVAYPQIVDFGKVQKEFEALGGKLIPFYLDRQPYWKEVKRLNAEHELIQ